MKSTLIRNILVLGIFSTYASSGLAAWEDVETELRYVKTQPSYQIASETLQIQLLITNPSNSTLEGPFRLLIKDAALTLLNASGATEDGVPYVEVPFSELNSKQHALVPLKFFYDHDKKRGNWRDRAKHNPVLQAYDSPWELVWSDEFDGDQINSENWTHEVDCNGGGNFEKQCYTDDPSNSFVADGVLNIVARSAEGQPLPYSSARLVGKNKQDFTYGRFEIRAKAPFGQGSWPAIWMLPTDDTFGHWPHSGEIDIFEAVNLKVPLGDSPDDGVQSDVYGTLWYGRSWPNQSHSGTSYTLPDGLNPADDFHVYAIEWEAGEIRWYVDDVLYQTQRNTEPYYGLGEAHGLWHRGWFTQNLDNGDFLWNGEPFDQAFHLILNFAVGGQWPENVNQMGIDATAFDESNPFQIDYVRVYQCSVDPLTGTGCNEEAADYDAALADGGTLNAGASPTPVRPSTGEAMDLVVFTESEVAEWPLWDSAGAPAPEVVVDTDGQQGNVAQFAIGDQPAVVGFNIYGNSPSLPYDGSPLTDTGVLEFDMKLVTPPNSGTESWYVKVESGGALTAAELPIAAPSNAWSHYSIPLRDLRNAGLDLNGIDVIMVFPAWGQGEGAVFQIDNVTIMEGDVPPLPSNDTANLVDNGSFSDGVAPWFNNAANVIDDGGNAVNYANVQAAGNPWDVNLSQVVNLIPGETYTLTFRAKGSEGRTLLAGLGLNHAPWDNVVETVVLGEEWQTFTYTLTPAFGDDNSRVLFDLGADTGEVYIDDVIVIAGENLLENSLFEEGATAWIGNAANVIDDGGNAVNYANVLAAGNPWDVNLSQEMALTPDTTYTVVFRAKGTAGRTLLAGLGLNHDPWTNVTEQVVLSGEWQVYSFPITTTGFGDANSRIIFDMGAATGEVLIDDAMVLGQAGGVIPEPVGPFDVTFSVDMSGQSLNPGDVVYVNGTFNGWCGACNPMADNGDGTWTVTLPLNPGSYDYKFTVNGWDAQENVPTECGVTVDVYTNRQIVITDSAVVTATTPYGGCP